MSNRQMLSLHTKPYKGKNNNLTREYLRRMDDTNKIEQYLNSIQTHEKQTKSVHEIAEPTRLGEECVRNILLKNGHGYHGITF